ncbi:hypothetical protein BC937DRAFT_89365 [Endogone sp. FLAS-F59071]|nr:hypothetical protein BC937DRAFT_89365 [Endogone sp. FLAS-F59071]|eukprot:RUS22408.1 hypothetical protein BC937DRAFT_89365 [Endogone sp. FLAS-F59071]
MYSNHSTFPPPPIPSRLSSQSLSYAPLPLPPLLPTIPTPNAPPLRSAHATPRPTPTPPSSAPRPRPLLPHLAWGNDISARKFPWDRQHAP